MANGTDKEAIGEKEIQLKVDEKRKGSNYIKIKVKESKDRMGESLIT